MSDRLPEQVIRKAFEGVTTPSVRREYEAALAALLAEKERLEEALRRIADPEAEWIRLKKSKKARLPYEIARAALAGDAATEEQT